MAAPVYRQHEILAMIAMPKTLDWGVEHAKDRSGDERSKVIPLILDDPQYTMKLEIRRNPDLGEYTVLLRGMMAGRDFEGVIRYDIQDNEHTNPPWYSPELILPGQPHQHVYNETAIRKRLEWDACADPIDLTSPSSNYLIGKFLVDVKIRTIDTATHTSLFDWMNDAGP